MEEKGCGIQARDLESACGVVSPDSEESKNSKIHACFSSSLRDIRFEHI